MPRVMSVHALPPGSFTREQLDQLAQAAQQNPAVRGHRSFANFAESKAVCIFDAADREALGGWFQEVGMPYDGITRVELEGDLTMIEEV